MTSFNQKEQKKAPRRPRSVWIWVLLLGVLFVLLSIYGPQNVTTTTWGRFEHDMLLRHAVEKIVIVDGEVAEIYLKKGFEKDSLFKDVIKPGWGDRFSNGPHYTLTIGSIDSFERKMDEAQKGFSPEQKVDIRYVHNGNWMTVLMSWLIPVAIAVVMYRMLWTRGKGGPSIFNFGRSTAAMHDVDGKSGVTFDDVAGLEEAKREVKEIVDFLQDPEHFTRLGAKIPKGVIIVGPTGTGKTLLAKAVAGQAGVPFFSLSGSEFVEMFVGVGASRVRDLFRRAKENAPSIIFIDEIDAVGRSRDRNAFYSGVNDERESTLNQLLTEMDGFGTNSGVIVLAATNRGEMLDPALLRPGRFDRHIYLDLPTQSERRAIFGVHLKPLLCDQSVDAEDLATQTPGFSGADIANLCNEAALIAARQNKQKVDKEAFNDALDRIVAGLERKSKILNDKEKKTVAFHESGHALASWLLVHTDPLIKVSIIPRGKSLGAAWYRPEEHALLTEAELSDKLCAMLAGRASEEVMLGEISSGALDDLEKVTREAYNMVTCYGFARRLGNISFYDSSYREKFQKPYSEQTAIVIDEEVRKIVDTAYQRAQKLITDHKSELTRIANLLLQREVIYKDDLESILGKRPTETSIQQHEQPLQLTSPR